MAVDGAGNVYIADRGNHVVRRVSNSGIISTFAGTGTSGYSGNGGAANLARLNAPFAVATDAAGNVYIADNGNNTIRVVNAAGIIRNYAGNGVAGYSGNGDTAHLGSLNGPQGIALDQVGNLYIADAVNNVIRMVAAGTRIMSTYAGNGTLGNGGNGGSATAASLYTPSGVATDAFGNLYIADQLNHVIRRVVASTGTIHVFAGTGAAGNSGDGGSALGAAMRFPSGVSVDGAGNVYIADQGNNNVRMVNTSGVISHVAGTSTNGYSGNGGLAVSAQLASPKSVYADGWGRVYIADFANHVIRVISSVSSVPTVAGSDALHIVPNPSNGIFTISLAAAAVRTTIAVVDMTGRVVCTASITDGVRTADLNLTHLPRGNYVVKVVSERSTEFAKVVLE